MSTTHGFRNHSKTRLFTALLSSTFWIANSACGGGGSMPPGPPAPKVSVSISPTSTNVAFGGTKRFQATVVGTSNTAVTWTLTGSTCSGSACGTLSSATENPVTYTSPSTIPAAPVTLTATAAADPNKSATAGITIVDVGGISVSVSPGSVNLGSQGTQTLTAVVTDPSNSGLTWERFGFLCNLGSCGSFSDRTQTDTGESIVYTRRLFQEHCQTA
jgi:hypothetical protein